MDKQVRKASFDLQALLACARGELFGPGNAKLPLPPLLMFDRISHICDVGGLFGKGEIRAELQIKPDLWFFKSHFVDDPVIYDAFRAQCYDLYQMYRVPFTLAYAGANLGFAAANNCAASAARTAKPSRVARSNGG